MQKLLARGDMSVDGMLACKLVRGGVDGDAFLDFVENGHLMATTLVAWLLDEVLIRIDWILD